MKEMVGGCCVCSDERGWPDNPLVYCDGSECPVAVHQACYGIVTVPTGPWFCRKCESPDSQARVRCELCPSRAGALKRSDSGGWAHVVCALYIPEVRFGNVTSMEPIILQLIPSERFNKVCYICQESGKINRASAGACMQCNKSGCKQQFHVTCAQSLGLLCEEAGNYLDNVKYCGYCRHHYGKLKKGGNVKTIPPYKPVSLDSHSSDSSPEKDLGGSPSTASSAPDTAGPLITLLPASKGSSKSSVPGRKTSGQSGNQSLNTSSENIKLSSVANPRLATTKSQSHGTPSETATTSGTYPKQTASNKSQASLPKASASQGKSDKAARKKTPPPASDNRKVSATVPIVGPCSETVSINITSEESQLKGAQPSAVTPSKLKEPIVVINELPISTSASRTTILTPALMEQLDPSVKFTNTNFTESVITQSDSVFGIGADAKQTKKRKAISHATASTSGYAVTSTITSSQATSGVISLNKAQWNVPNPSDRSQDWSKEDKNKSKLDQGKLSAEGHSISSINIPMKSSHSSYACEPGIISSSSSQGSSCEKISLSSSSSTGEVYSRAMESNPDSIFITPPSPGPSTSSWGLKIAYEPQTSQLAQSDDLIIDESHSSRRSEAIDAKHGEKSPDNISLRNKKRAPPATSSPVIMMPRKKKRDIGAEGQDTIVCVSPSSSPERSSAKVTKPPVEKMYRAPHMLGNELNPESAAAARLSEHLNAELAAHSVFRAPSPLVHPPLMNRATSSSRGSGPQSGAGPSSEGAGLGGSTQSLDQLLERQWEQGSQFLMEQAQHFDIASLLSCLHQLRTENVRLQDYIGSLSQRRDHLLAVNARLAIPLNTGNVPAEVPRGPRDSNGNPLRAPSQVRSDGNRANSVERQQMATRDIQPRTS